jgi:hypothetical protein
LQSARALSSVATSRIPAGAFRSARPLLERVEQVRSYIRITKSQASKPAWRPPAASTTGGTISRIAVRQQLWGIVTLVTLRSSKRFLAPYLTRGNANVIAPHHVSETVPDLAFPPRHSEMPWPASTLEIVLLTRAFTDSTESVRREWLGYLGFRLGEFVNPCAARQFDRASRRREIPGDQRSGLPLRQARRHIATPWLPRRLAFLAVWCPGGREHLSEPYSGSHQQLSH